MPSTRLGTQTSVSINTYKPLTRQWSTFSFLVFFSQNLDVAALFSLCCWYSGVYVNSLEVSFLARHARLVVFPCTIELNQ